MPSARPLSRRKQLVVRAAIVSLVLIAAAAGGAMLLLRRPSGTYEPGSNLEGITRQLQRDLPEDYPRVRFEDVTEKAGIDFRHFAGTRSTQLPEDMGSGAAWGDYDGDGWLDLYVCDIAAPLTASEEELAAAEGGNRLYHNNGAGGFTDVTAEAGVGFKGQSMAAAWADFDNDARLDLTTTAYGRLVLYRNLGDGRFEDVSARLGLADHEGFWTGVSWSDYDRDGDADLYVCGYVRYEFRPEYSGRASKQYAQLIPFTLNPSSYKPERNLLFRNNGDGTFTETATQAGVDNPGGRSLAAAWSDFGLDGWADLYVANDVSDNALYRNRGDGTFEDISHPAWAADHRGTMGLALTPTASPTLSPLRNDRWQETSFTWGLEASGTLVDFALADYDSDGLVDVCLLPWRKPMVLYRNEGGGRFANATEAAGLGRIRVQGFSTIFFDFNRDGAPDLLHARHAEFAQVARFLIEPGPSEEGGSVVLFRNTGQGRFEPVRLEGSFRSLSRPMGTMQVSAGDLDGDGWPDLVFANGSLGGSRIEPSVVLRNLSGRGFSFLGSLSKLGNFQGTSVVDVDVDGRAEIYLAANPVFRKSSFEGGLLLRRGGGVEEQPKP